MKNLSRQLLSLFCAGAVSVPSLALAQAAPDLGNDPYEWDHFFPIWGKQVAKKGIQLPLPWGVGLNYSYVDQEVNITSLDIAVNDSEFVDLSDMIEFDEIRSRVHVLNARLDLWLFPFMSVYALGLYAPQAYTDVAIAEPFTFDAGNSQSGVGGGFGTTFAFGLGGFFGTVDMNWSWNQMESLHEPVTTFILTPRIGKNFGQVGGVRLVAWVGAMRQKIGSITNGSIGLSDTIEGDEPGFGDDLNEWYDGLPPARQAVVRGIVERMQDRDGATIHYRLKKELATPWNMTLGGELGINERFQIRAEVGFIGRTQFIGGFNYRFGVFSPSKDEEKEPPPDMTPSKEAAAKEAAAKEAAAKEAAAKEEAAKEEAAKEEAAKEEAAKEEAAKEEAAKEEAAKEEAAKEAEAEEKDPSDEGGTDQEASGSEAPETPEVEVTP